MYFLMNGCEDATLVTACLGGDNRAFETLVRRYYRPVYNVALRMLKSPEAAEDVAQTVFVRAYEKLDRYDPRHRFFSWVYRIAVNESINEAKKAKRTESYESGIGAAMTDTPLTEVAEYELAEAVGAAIMELSVDHRMVIVLRHYHDFSYREMSEILDIPEKTVRSRLFTARQRLKGILEGQGVTG